MNLIPLNLLGVLGSVGKVILQSGGLLITFIASFDRTDVLSSSFPFFGLSIFDAGRFGFFFRSTNLPVWMLVRISIQDAVLLSIGRRYAKEGSGDDRNRAIDRVGIRMIFILEGVWRVSR